MKKIIVAIFIFLFSVSLFSQNKKVKFEEYTLDNGLQVILNQDKTSPMVVVNICYHVGSKNETEGRKGFAHLFEHLMFDGSANVKRGEFSKYVNDAGGSLNAFTSNDITNYYTILPPHELELGLWLESDRMFQFSIGEVSLTTQQGVVIEEKKQSYDNRPYGTMTENMYAMAYKVHPYKTTVIGYESDINAATLEDVKDFFETFYVPNNATLVIAGDFDVKETKELIKKYFGDILKGTKEIIRKFPAEPPRPAQEIKLVYDKIMLDALFMSYHVPGFGHKDSYVLDILSNILSSGRSSRLYERMVHTDQVATTVSTGAGSLEDPGLFQFFVFSSGKATATELEKIIYEEIEKIQTAGITEKELEKAQNRYEANFLGRVKTTFQRALLLAIYKVFGNDANLINTELDKYLAVTTQDVQDVAKKYLNKENSVVLYYKPQPK
jgi:predicted Zn-dependent peptidase